MAKFTYREKSSQTSSVRLLEILVVIIVFVMIAIALAIKGHKEWSVALLIFSGLIGTMQVFKTIRQGRISGNWVIDINEETFKWASPASSLGPEIELPLREIDSLVVSSSPESELGSGNSFHLVTTDGRRVYLWGYERAPMDKVINCLEANGVTIERENT